MAAAALVLGAACNRQPTPPPTSSTGLTPIAPEHLSVGGLGSSSVAAANGDLLLPASVHADFPEDRNMAHPIGFMGISIDASGHTIFTAPELQPGDGNRHDGLDPYFHGFEIGESLFVAGFLGVTEHGREARDSHDDDGLILKRIDDAWARVAIFDCEPFGIVSVVPLDASSVMLVGVCGDNTQPAKEAPAIILQRFDGKTLQPIDHELEGELIGAAMSGEHMYVATANNVQAYSTVTGEWTDLGDVGPPNRSSGAIRAIAPYDGGVVIGGGFVRVDGIGGFGNVALLRVSEPPAPLGRIRPHKTTLREKLGSLYEPVEALCVLVDGRLVAGGANPMRLAAYDPATEQWTQLGCGLEPLGRGSSSVSYADLTLSEFSVVTHLHAAPDASALVLQSLGMPGGEVIEVEPGEEYTAHSGRVRVHGGNAALRALPPKMQLTALARFGEPD